MSEPSKEAMAAKQAVSRILVDALQGHVERYRMDGFIRWGLVEREIHEAIDREFAALRARAEAADGLASALRAAYVLIVRHHEASVSRFAPGKFCPVCHNDDGSEPEMDRIAVAITAYEKAKG